MWTFSLRSRLLPVIVSSLYEDCSTRVVVASEGVVRLGSMMLGTVLPDGSVARIFVHLGGLHVLVCRLYGVCRPQDVSSGFVSDHRG